MYRVAVKIEGIENRRRSAVLLHAMMGLFLIVKASDYYRLIAYRNFLPVVPVLLVGSFSLFYGLFRRKVDTTHEYNDWLRLLQVLTFAVLGIMLVGVSRNLDYLTTFVFALLSLFLFFSERHLFDEAELFLEEQGIRIPGPSRRELLHWEQLNEVVVREDFVTLFQKKGKYLQFQVMQDLSTLEVAKMNAFCREKIEGREEKGRLGAEEERQGRAS